MIELAGAKGDITHLAFSPDARLLATSGGGRGLELWDITNANKWGKHVGMAFGDGPVHFHPTKPLFFGSYLHSVPEIDTSTKRARMLLVDGKGINFFWTKALLPDGSGFVCHCNGNYHFRGVIWRLRWAADKMLQLDWAIQLGNTSPRAPKGGQPRIIQCVPDGKTFITLDSSEGSGPWSPGTLSRLTMRSLKDGKVLETATLPGRTALTMAIAPDSTGFVTCQGNALSVWDTEDVSAKPQTVRSHSKAHFTGVAFHQSGRYLAATSNDATVKLYDTTTWTVAKTFTWNIGRMRSIAFSPDGTLAAADSDTGKVVVWDVDL